MEELNGWPKELIELFDDPLLEGVRPRPTPVTEDARTQMKIDELRQWIESNGREPDMNCSSIKEKLLAVSLQTLREMGLWM